MADELLTYFERELTFLRQMGAEFAAKYPKIAGRLQLEADKSEDPHVERLIQAFAFLTGRVHHKIDDELPEITESLLSVLYPHYLAPVPSMAIVQFVLDPDQGKLTSGHLIERHATLYSQPVAGMPCRFRTCYPVTLWPLEVAAARFEPPDRHGAGVKGAAVLRLDLRTLGGVALPELELDQLRFFLSGESVLANALYELLFNNTIEVQLRPLEDEAGSPDDALAVRAGIGTAKGQPLGGATAPIVLPPRSLLPVGFEADEGMLPYTGRSFLGYRLLQEYFSFPEKFLFFDLLGLARAGRAGFRDGVTVLFCLDHLPRFEQPIRPETFRLGCAPIVNLFEQIAEPIRVNQAQTEYRVIADVRRQTVTEVYAVNRVTVTSPEHDEPVRLPPFYAFKEGGGEQPQAFWYTSRRPSPKKGDPGTEVYLSLVDLNFRPTVPASDTLTLHATCTNRDLPGKLPFGGDRADFELEGAAPLARIRCLTKPTETVRPPLRRGAQWRLISHLTLNYLSIADGGREALQEILRLYDFSASPVIQQQIGGITAVRSRRVVGRPAAMPWNGFCRGLEVTIEFDEQKYVGSGLFLFASVLERFLGLYAGLNSFSQLVVRTRQREEPLRQWTPRAGEQILL